MATQGIPARRDPGPDPTKRRGAGPLGDSVPPDEVVEAKPTGADTGTLVVEIAKTSIDAIAQIIASPRIGIAAPAGASFPTSLPQPLPPSATVPTPATSATLPTPGAATVANPTPTAPRVVVPSPSGSVPESGGVRIPQPMPGQRPIPFPTGAPTPQIPTPSGTDIDMGGGGGGSWADRLKGFLRDKGAPLALGLGSMAGGMVEQVTGETRVEDYAIGQMSRRFLDYNQNGIQNYRSRINDIAEGTGASFAESMQIANIAQRFGRGATKGGAVAIGANGRPVGTQEQLNQASETMQGAFALGADRATYFGTLDTLGRTGAVGAAGKGGGFQQDQKQFAVTIAETLASGRLMDRLDEVLQGFSSLAQELGARGATIDPETLGKAIASANVQADELGDARLKEKATQTVGDISKTVAGLGYDPLAISQFTKMPGKGTGPGGTSTDTLFQYRKFIEGGDVVGQAQLYGRMFNQYTKGNGVEEVTSGKMSDATKRALMMFADRQGTTVENISDMLKIAGGVGKNVAQGKGAAEGGTPTTSMAALQESKEYRQVKAQGSIGATQLYTQVATAGTVDTVNTLLNKTAQDLEDRGLETEQQRKLHSQLQTIASSSDTLDTKKQRAMEAIHYNETNPMARGQKGEIGQANRLENFQVQTESLTRAFKELASYVNQFNADLKKKATEQIRNDLIMPSTATVADGDNKERDTPADTRRRQATAYAPYAAAKASTVFAHLQGIGLHPLELFSKGTPNPGAGGVPGGGGGGGGSPISLGGRLGGVALNTITKAQQLGGSLRSAVSTTFAAGKGSSGGLSGVVRGVVGVAKQGASSVINTAVNAFKATPSVVGSSIRATGSGLVNTLKAGPASIASAAKNVGGSMLSRGLGAFSKGNLLLSGVSATIGQGGFYDMAMGKTGEQGDVFKTDPKGSWWDNAKRSAKDWAVRHRAIVTTGASLLAGAAGTAVAGPVGGFGAGIAANVATNALIDSWLEDSEKEKQEEYLKSLGLKPADPATVKPAPTTTAPDGKAIAPPPAQNTKDGRPVTPTAASTPAPDSKPMGGGPGAIEAKSVSIPGSVNTPPTTKKKTSWFGSTALGQELSKMFDEPDGTTVPPAPGTYTTPPTVGPDVASNRYEQMGGGTGIMDTTGIVPPDSTTTSVDESNIDNAMVTDMRVAKLVVESLSGSGLSTSSSGIATTWKDAKYVASEVASKAPGNAAQYSRDNQMSGQLSYAYNNVIGATNVPVVAAPTGPAIGPRPENGFSIPPSALATPAVASSVPASAGPARGPRPETGFSTPLPATSSVTGSGTASDGKKTTWFGRWITSLFGGSNTGDGQGSGAASTGGTVSANFTSLDNNNDERMQKLNADIVQAAKEVGLQPEALKALVYQENRSLNSNQVTPNSWSPAVGLTQMTVKTARGLLGDEVKGMSDSQLQEYLQNDSVNLRAGGKYLAQKLQQAGGDLAGAYRGYYTGDVNNKKADVLSMRKPDAEGKLPTYSGEAMNLYNKLSGGGQMAAPVAQSGGRGRPGVASTVSVEGLAGMPIGVEGGGTIVMGDTSGEGFLRAGEDAYISQKWGNTDPSKRLGYSFHSGLDIAPNMGTGKVYTATAPESGTVLRSSWSGVNHSGYTGDERSYGNFVLMQGESGYRHRLSHLDPSTAEEVKQKMQKGQHIDFQEMVGRVGTTGNSSGKHIDWEVYKKKEGTSGEKDSDWQVMDPMEWLRQHNTRTVGGGRGGGSGNVSVAGGPMNFSPVAGYGAGGSQKVEISIKLRQDEKGNIVAAVDGPSTINLNFGGDPMNGPQRGASAAGMPGQPVGPQTAEAQRGAIVGRTPVHVGSR